MKNILKIFILTSMVFFFSNKVMASNEFDLYLDYLHSGRTETGDVSTDYNLVAVGVNYLSEKNFLSGAEFGFGSSAAYIGGSKTSQNFINLKFGFRVLDKKKYKLDPVISVFSLTDKSDVTIQTLGTLIGPEFKYLITEKFAIDLNYYFSLSGSVKVNKHDIGEDGKISKYEIKFKYAISDGGLFVFGLRDVSYSGGALERTNSGFTLGYQHKF
ncbi:MAG: hypothetical protein GXY86_16160 [Firmicutes bacterium]|nr:hypothetical protein [Bacillota bacterium]